MSDREDQGMERFERQFRRWAERPPRTSPAAAKARITAALQPRRNGLPVWRMAAAAAGVLLLICGSWGVLKLTDGSLPHGPGGETSARTDEFVPPPLDENVVLWWLDDETPVYFVLGGGDQG